jgi:hypothetical protein
MEEELRKRKDGWIEAWLAIEALAINRETAGAALKAHVEKLENAKDTLVYEKKFSEISRVENPLQNVKEGFSQVAEVRLFAKDIFTMVNIVLLYGPSSVEILGPKEKSMKIGEIQEMCNLLSGLVHQFAAAGLGGVVITPK